MAGLPEALIPQGKIKSAMPQLAFASRRAPPIRQNPGQVRPHGPARSNPQPTIAEATARRFHFPGIPLFPPRPSSTIRPKLAIGSAHDPVEREADRAAALVMRAHHPAAVPADLADASPAPSASRSAIPAPPGVDAVLRTAGRPLEVGTRTFFEPRFGRDFSKVRVHTDAESAASARAIHAQAYAYGQHIVFASNQFAPDSPQGRSLLAHELAHVAQSNGDPTQIHRKAVSTWAGAFDTDIYNPWKGKDEDNKDVCGAQIKLRFSPGAAVEADKINLVQIASSTVNGKVVPMEHGALGSSTAWTPPDSSFHVDTSTNTPLYAQTPGADSKLASSTPITGDYSDVDWKQKTITDFGYRKKSGKDFATKEPWLYDEPSLTARQSDSASQHFETAAIAVEGKQQGAFYGSVRWGYDKAAGKLLPKLMEPKIGANSTPSSDFLAAAKAWNEFKPKQGDVLPLPTEQFTSDAVLYAQQDSGSIKAGDQVTLLPDSSSSKGNTEVIVVSGPRKGTRGTIPSSQVSSKPPASHR
jgi:hypothetical protein